MNGIRSFSEWKRILPPERVNDLARKTGFGPRTPRKVSAREFFWAMVLGFGVGPKRCVAQIAHFLGIPTGIVISRQGFHQRFTAQTVTFFPGALATLMQHAADSMRGRLPGCPGQFKDLSLLESTTVRLFNRLVKKFPACRKNVRVSALKIHVCMNLPQNQAERIRITAERVHDRKEASVGEWVRGRLLLFDLGFFDYGLFAMIRQSGGDFVTRLKDYANGVIVAIREGWQPGRLGAELNGGWFHGDRVDLDVRFIRGSEAPVFRVVGLWDTDLKAHHWYVTSLSPEDFSADEIARICRLRWQIELLFKDWKSICRIHSLPSGREAVVLALVYASLCAAVLSRLAAWLACRRARLAWHALSNHVALTVLDALATSLGKAILAGRGSDLRDVVDDPLIGIAVHAPTSSRSRAVVALTTPAN